MEILTAGLRNHTFDLAAVTFGILEAFGFSKIFHPDKASGFFPCKKNHEYPAPSSAQAFVAIKFPYLIIVSRVSCPELSYLLLEILTDFKGKMFYRNPGFVGSDSSKTIGALRILDYGARRAAWFELTFIYRKKRYQQLYGI
ncbi:MAG: hypothetical protein KJ822_01515 [Proteobacteria bacterium]|nr:hypothetical protein [Pseudomonadota bacterium]